MLPWVVILSFQPAPIRRAPFSDPAGRFRPGQMQSLTLFHRPRVTNQGPQIARCGPVKPQQERLYPLFLDAVTELFFHNEGGTPSILSSRCYHAGNIT
jgi:hypothetical protein